uniref:Uncharacterized protein n=1 Tax=Microviridae sp. ctCoW18 TaxID=2826730 RepID=A0A8S5NPS6_9VIRU|nr:MAG TPA: hypothetical protein [Microviridae sp. ctCoW18]
MQGFRFPLHPPFLFSFRKMTACSPLAYYFFLLFLCVSKNILL